jgi:hypothetical protein
MPVPMAAFKTTYRSTSSLAISTSIDRYLRYLEIAGPIFEILVWRSWPTTSFAAVFSRPSM